MFTAVSQMPHADSGLLGSLHSHHEDMQAAKEANPFYTRSANRHARLHGSQEEHPHTLGPAQWRCFPLGRRPESRDADALREPLQNPQRSGRGGGGNLQALKSIFLHPFCAPLVCVPLGIMAGEQGWGYSWVFWLNFLALIPLAKIVGDATEELAECLKSDTISGILNATFGNAVEMIVSIQSVRHGLFSVVKASLLGSVLSNILLVLGSAFLLGGLSKSKSKQGKFHSIHVPTETFSKQLCGMEKEQKFPGKTALTSMAMLLFACMTMVLPTIFSSSHAEREGERKVLQVSRIGAVVSAAAYVMYLVFQLVTHRVTLQMDEDMRGDAAESKSSADDAATATPTTAAAAAAAAVVASVMHPEEGAEAAAAKTGEEEASAESLSLWCALSLMLVATLVVAVTSGFLVDTLQEVAERSGIPMGFIGVVLLPIAGNACEHASALRFCALDRPGLAIGIAVGSATQVAMMVVPFAVMVGQVLGQPLDMDFGTLNVCVVTFSVLVVSVLLLDGRSNWFKGFLLLAMYVFIAALYWCLPPDFGEDGGL